MTDRHAWPTNRTSGILCGLLIEAALFGVTPPLCKRLLTEMSPLILPGCLYLAGGIALSQFLSGWRLLRATGEEAALRKEDAPLLLGIALREYEHAHTHDDHHQHLHSPDDPPSKPHVHRHKHAAIEHKHSHASNVHHGHKHGPVDG